MSAQIPRALPDDLQAWAQRLAESVIVEIAGLGGGMTNTKWLLRLAEGDPLVLRWPDPAVWGEKGREHVRREALACRLLADSTLPVPRLLGSDPDGATVTSGPVDLMTWRPGHVRLDRLAPDAITALAGVAVSLHRQPVPPSQRPPLFTFRGRAEPEVPQWARWPELWRQAIELFMAGPPPTPYGLLHRDFHLGNTLWEGDAVTGLVDWAETSWGPPDLDVAHMCSDFAMLHTVTEAETFRAAYVAQGGRLDADPEAARFWMVSDILGFLPDPAHILAAVGPNRPDLSPDDIRRGSEDLLAVTLG